MGTAQIITLVILAAIALYAVLLYNGLVTLKHNVGRAWSNIEVLLKQRHDELPKLDQDGRMVAGVGEALVRSADRR